jgi:hypothetical protein
MLDPDVPDFAGRNRHRGLTLDPVNLADQLVDGLVAAIDGLVADNDAVDVAMLAGEVDDSGQFALVALAVPVNPGAHRNLEPEFPGDLGDEFGPAGRGIGPDHAGVGRDGLQIGPDLVDGGPAAGAGAGGAVERCVGNAGKLPVEVRCVDDVPGGCPQASMHNGNGNADNRDEAHQSDQMGLGSPGAVPSPGWAIAAKQLLLI